MTILFNNENMDVFSHCNFDIVFVFSFGNGVNFHMARFHFGMTVWWFVVMMLPFWCFSVGW